MLVNSVIFQTLFQVILLLAFATRHPSLSALFFLFSLIVIFSSFKKFRHMSLLVKIVGVSFTVVTGFMFALNIFRYPPAVVFWVLGIVTYLSVVLLLSNKETFRRASGITLYAFQAVAFFSFAYFGFENFPWANPLEKIIPGASANGITSYVVILQINYSLCQYVRGKKAPTLSMIFTVIIATAGYGRGSIVSGILIILLTVGMQFFTKNRYKMFIAVGAVVVFGFFTYLKNQDAVDFFFLSKTKFSSAGVKSSHREFMMNDYMNKINLTTFFQGAGYENTAITTYYHENPHNSYIRAHNIFGLPYLIIIFVMPFVTYFFYKKRTHVLFSFVLLMILSLRCFTEPNLFPSIMDFYYFALLLYPATIIQNINNSTEDESKIVAEAQ
ncbi:MAG: hypothetical protein ACJA0Q_000786 [Saprospiraceae bacterium]|jgi:hypothetical protein